MSIFRSLPQEILQVARLTKDGKLREATQVIQSALRGAHDRNRTAREANVGSDPAPKPRHAWHAPSTPTHDFPPPDTLGPGMFTKETFSNAAGTLSFKLYVPIKRREGAMPLLVMLHGCTQSSNDFAAGTRMNQLAEEQGFIVAYPDQAESANHSRCWNWFRLQDQARGAGEPSLIAGITSQIARTHPVDRKRIYVAGLSAGGAMAAILAATYPDLYAAVGVHSGLADGSASNIPSAFSAMKHGSAAPARLPSGHMDNRAFAPLVVFHGDADSTVHPKNGGQLVEQAVARAAKSHAVDLSGKPDRVAGIGNRRAYTRINYTDASGHTLLEYWVVHGGGHAWSGGSKHGSYTDERGPDASREMIRFFSTHQLKS